MLFSLSANIICICIYKSEPLFFTNSNLSMFKILKAWKKLKVSPWTHWVQHSKVFYSAEFSTTRTCVMMSWALLEVGALKMVYGWSGATLYTHTRNTCSTLSQSPVLFSDSSFRCQTNKSMSLKTLLKWDTGNYSCHKNIIEHSLEILHTAIIINFG